MVLLGPITPIIVCYVHALSEGLYGGECFRIRIRYPSSQLLKCGPSLLVLQIKQRVTITLHFCLYLQ